MANIRYELVWVAIGKTYASIDYKLQNNIDKRHEFRKQTILADESLTKGEKTEAIKELYKDYNFNKIFFNEGTKRICENCQDECLATLYCEICIQNYLKAKFSNWTSGNNDIDNLIQKCQEKIYVPHLIIEWIPYNNLKNIKYLTKGGCSEIYTADWIGGAYYEWDNKVQQLKRLGTHKVILKRLVNVESANRSWLDEGKTHLTISSKYFDIAQCYGLTKDPSDGSYILVMREMDMNLRKYLQQNHNKLTWKERIQIARHIIVALERIHFENAIHRDLHSGNVLFNEIEQRFYISDFGFCGPADKPLKSIYGNLPYIAPEVIAGEETTFASDIYSIGMLMWEISSGLPPFVNYEYNYDLTMKIINGMRPKIITGTPLEYKKLMEQCWDADPTKRPADIYVLRDGITELYQDEKEQMITYQVSNNSVQAQISNSINCVSSSKIYQFENFPEPKNATEEEQEAFHSKAYDFSIPDNIDDFNNSNNENNNSTSKRSFLEDNNESFSKVFKKLKINSNNDI